MSHGAAIIPVTSNAQNPDFVAEIPWNMEHLSTITTTIESFIATDLVTTGEGNVFLYIGGSGTGGHVSLTKYDVSDPENPAMEWNEDLTERNIGPMDVKVSGASIYIANSLNGIAVYGDAGDSAVFLGRNNFARSSTALDLYECGSLAAVVDNGDGGITIYNVTNPANITVEGEWTQVTGVYRSDIQVLSGIHGNRTYAFITGDDGVFRVVDITIPDQAVEVDNYDFGVACKGLYLTTVDFGPTIGDRWVAFVTTTPAALYVLDIQDPEVVSYITHIEFDTQVISGTAEVAVYQPEGANVRHLAHVIGFDTGPTMYGIMRTVDITDLATTGDLGIAGGYSYGHGTWGQDIEVGQDGVVFAGHIVTGALVYEMIQSRYFSFQYTTRDNQYDMLSIPLYPVKPNAMSTEYYFDGHLGDNFSIAYRNDGNYYIPPNIDLIDSVQTWNAYNCYMEESTNWTFTGWALHPETPCTLRTNQYSWVPYLQYFEEDVEDAFASIADDINIMYDSDGGIWIPSIPLNTIQDLEHGRGYQLYQETGHDIIFQYDFDPAVQRRATSPVYEAADLPDAPPPTGLPYAVLVYMDEGVRAFDPYAVEVYDGDLLVGKGAVPDNFDFTLVIVWREDEEMNLRGFREDHPMRIVVKGARDRVILVSDGAREHLFNEAGYSEIHLGMDQMVDGWEGPGFEAGEGYPLPFNPVVSVPFIIPHSGEVEFAVYNILGRQLYHEVQTFAAGRHVFQFDSRTAATSMSSGMYIVRVGYGEEVLTRKIIMMK